MLCAGSVLLLTLAGVSCDDGLAGIELGEVGQADVVELVDAPATVVATMAATLTAGAGGTLAELRVLAGAEVERGEVLAVIDSPDAQRRLAQADQALAAADQAVAAAPRPAGTGELATAQLATDRAAGQALDRARQAADQLADQQLREALLAQVDAAREQYELAAAAARSAVAAAEQGAASLGAAAAALSTAQQLQARQAYALAKATVDELTLRAPFDGVVQLGGSGVASSGLLGDLLEAVEGTAAGSGTAVPGPPPGVDPAPAPGTPVRAGTPVLTVVDLAELGVVAQVDEADVLLVAPGVRAEVELGAAPDARYGATVTAVDPLPTRSAGGVGVAYRVRLELAGGRGAGRPAPAPVPRPGMSAVAHLRVAQALAAVAVPAEAVFRAGAADVVWEVRDGRATRTRVLVGVRGRELVQITAGLHPGDRIVVRGAHRVTDGQRLR